MERVLPGVGAARRGRRTGGRLRRHRLLHWRGPPGPRSSRPPAVLQARPATARRPRGLHPGRLRHRHRRRNGDLPRWTHRPLSDVGGQHNQRKAAFGNLCTACPLRERCTKAKAGRILTIRPHHDLTAAPSPTTPGSTPEPPPSTSAD
ncbi:transposase [Streptomyces sp. NPDC001832]|uniref:transposase n=1 Tax=Streptomyces sp. NPDC001832 TaxID=3154527 RepID=UPI003321F5D9